MSEVMNVGVMNVGQSNISCQDINMLRGVSIAQQYKIIFLASTIHLITRQKFRFQPFHSRLHIMHECRPKLDITTLPKERSLAPHGMNDVPLS